MQIQQCLFCGHVVQMEHVHGHYQCPICYTNALPCCDGDNCSTNNLLANTGQEKSHPALQQDGPNNISEK